MSVPVPTDERSPQTGLVGPAVAWLDREVARLGMEHAEPRRWLSELTGAARALTASQPAMAAFLAVATRALEVAESAVRAGVPRAEAEGRVREALAAWLRDWTAAGDA